MTKTDDRAVFQAYLSRFLIAVADSKPGTLCDPHVFEHGDPDTSARYTEKNLDYINWFTLITANTLELNAVSEFDSLLFRAHFLLAAPEEPCCRYSGVSPAQFQETTECLAELCGGMFRRMERPAKGRREGQRHSTAA
jgi:hypothetical protein